MSSSHDIEILTDRLDVLVCHKCEHPIPVTGIQPFTEIKCPSCQTTQKVPVRLGPFFLLEELGRGAMGAVYKGLDPTLGRYVAIKVMRKELGDDAGALEGFLREARAAAALNHRNVVQIYSCGQEKGQPYLVMELVAGGRMDELMTGHEPMDEAQVMKIGVDIAQGLEAAHEIGLVHGDIKPANILFGRDGAAKVVDFGLARFAASQEAPGEVWGTPFYVAPEKIRKQPEDHRSDIYSLGATLYHALSGQPPFDGDTATDVVLARLDAPVPDVRSVRARIHPETAEGITRMLQPDPARRYPTYKSLLPDLRESLRVSRDQPLPKEPTQGKGKGRRALWAVVGVLLTALVAGGLFLASREDDTEEKKPTKWLLVDGKLVPVYDDGQEPKPPPQELKPELPEPQPEPPVAAVVPRVQPFAGKDSEQLMGALSSMADGKDRSAESQLVALHGRLDKNETAGLWVKVFLVALSKSAGWPTRADQHGAAVRKATLPDIDGAPHPGVMAQDLARFSGGELDEAQLRQGTKRWPGWYADLVEFFSGLGVLEAGDFGHATVALKTYAGKKRAEDAPAWPYALQPLAVDWRKQCEQWSEVERSVKAKTAKGQFEPALTELRQFEQQASRWFKTAVAKERAHVHQLVAQEAKQSQARLEEHYQQVQSDLDQIDAARATAVPMVAALDFDEARRTMRNALPGLQTQEGRDWLYILIMGYDRMDDLKDFVMNSIQEAPFGPARKQELGGTAVGAGREGIRVAIDGRVETLKSWDQVGSRLYLWMVNHYLSMPGMDAADRADALVSAALYSYEAGKPEPATHFARQAIEQQAAMITLLQRHMPGLLPDE